MSYSNKKIFKSFFEESNQQYLWSLNLSKQINLQKVQYKNYTMVQRGQVQSVQIGLLEQFLVLINQNNVKYINFENMTMRLLKKEDGDYGIQLNNQLEFYGDIDQMYQKMKKYCIQINFEENYQFIGKVGKGTFAEVLKAVQLKNRQTYAIKCFPKSLILDKEDRLAIIKEFSILRKIQHEMCIKLHEIFESADSLYLVIELVEGGELFDYLKNSKPFSEHECAKLINKLLIACAYMHENNIIHRDLKPENIFLRESNNLDNICVGDFGLADYYNPKGQYLFTRCGTPGFVAPEVLQDKPYDFKVDIYSIGLLMYLIVTGVPPFFGKDYEEIVVKNYEGHINFSKPPLSNQGHLFLRGLLNLNPKNRFSAQEALNHQWFIQEGVKKVNQQFKLKSLTNLPEQKSQQSFSNLKSPQIERRTLKYSDDKRTSIIIKEFQPQQKKVSSIKTTILDQQPLQNSTYSPTSSLPNLQELASPLSARPLKYKPLKKQ